MSTRLHEYEITKSSLLPLHPFVEYVPQRIASDELSQASSSSCGTVYHSPNRKPSPSPGSQRSVSSTRLCVRNENVPLRRDASRSSLPVTPTPISASSRRLARGKLLHRSSWENEPPPARRLHNAPSPLSDPGRLEDVDLGDLHRNDHLEPVQNYGLSFDIKSKENLSTPRHVSDSSQEPAVARKFSVTMDHPFKYDRPFRKWVSNLRQNPRERTRSLTVREARWDLDEGQSRPVKRDLPRRERKSSSWSPFGFVAKGRTPESQVTSKLESQSKKQTGRRFLRSNRNSLVSDTSNCRMSMEDRPTSAQSSDQAPLERALQRRRVLDELLGSEESYVADLKVLLHVYVFILDSAPKVAQATQPGISQNVGEMLQLHEQILSEIIALSTASEPRKRPKHARWHSIETLESVIGEKATHAVRRSLDVPWFGKSKQRIPLTAPRDAANVAKVFERMLPRFFLYEEYGAKYESMLQGMGSLSKTMPTWSTYERGIESLVNSLLPQSGGTLGSKKGLTFEDLLIKPIQRVCRYPLLFAELYKHTPAIDDPESKAEVEKVYLRLRETAQEINKATNDQQVQIKIQRSWRLQDLLVFPKTSPVPFSLRLLGYASLCGVLHVAYRSTHEVLGDFMLCALFKSHLLLASPRPGMSSFEIVAIISINDVHLEKADNGKGLQCYTAPFSWKLIFESDQLLYEIILCACTVREEEQWKASIQEHAIKGNQVGAKGSPILNLLSFEHSVLCLDIKPLGPVFGLPGTLMRRQSIQRAATTNHRRHACQIIIKNTFSLKETGESPMKRSGTLSRSRSLLSTHHIPVLAPRRVDRQRMEQKMSDVWTKDRLPYPGMAGHRGGHLIRTSATTVMRKISFASPTNPISSLERRTTTSGSMGDGKSDLTSFERVLENQTDGTSSPMPEYTHTPLNAIDSTLEYQDPNPYSKCTLPTPEEGAIDLAEDDDQTDVQDESMSRQVSEVSTVVASRDSKELYHEKGKPSKPKTLLKAFSTESIRGWFH